jgi:hypothetical protein
MLPPPTQLTHFTGARRMNSRVRNLTKLPENIAIVHLRILHSRLKETKIQVLNTTIVPLQRCVRIRSLTLRVSA